MLRPILSCLALFTLASCGTAADLPAASPQPATPVVTSVAKFLTRPASITVAIKPRVEGIAVYAGYWGPELPTGDPGYKYVTGVTKAAGFQFTVPGATVCSNAFTDAKTVAGATLPTGTAPGGIELKFMMPNGWAAGQPGITPDDNEVATVLVDGVALAPLPYITYNSSPSKNLYLSSWLLGCTP